MNPYDQLCIKSDVCGMAVCDGVNVCKHAAQDIKVELPSASANSAMVPCAIYGDKHDTCKLWFNCSCGDLPCGIARHQ